ncbi:hypothetical protein EXE57_19310 [Nocardioides euryhalodurans]|uniref:Peptidase MA-like domain-containing protein n=1 Tax=Nocardioides euryhalodurans TaxID=2518370 RepID=A0A4P7GQ96_9ACTN|nr:hypothetical protein EXE57_19310 [Nocardioides euryhalodurans]
MVLVLAVVGWVVLTDDEYVAPPATAPAAAVRPGEAAATLRDLEAALSTGDPDAAAALAPDGDDEAAALLRALAGNADRIQVEDLTLRYVDSLGGVDGDGRWTATVETGWRFAGFDPVPATAEVEFLLEAEDDRTAIAGVGGATGRTPVWLAGPVDVVRQGDVLVVAAADAGGPAALARNAVPVVRRVLPSWRSGLVVEVPPDASALDGALGAEPGEYAAVAAVTGRVGDDGSPRTPVHVLLNPAVFGELDRQGAQVVMSHEAVHVATGAAVEPDAVPPWLTEGYADYVALRDVDLPLSVTAAQVIRRVRRDGAPAALPGDEAFDTRTTHLGASYEASWIACTMLAERSGEQVLTRFYTGLEVGDDVAAEFRAAFGLSLAAFTEQWRDRLTDLAG